jgi:hypothetical protein
MGRHRLGRLVASVVRSGALAVLYLQLLGCEALFVPVADPAETQQVVKGETVMLPWPRISYQPTARTGPVSRFYP